MPERAAASMRSPRRGVQACALVLALAPLAAVIGHCTLSPQIPFVHPTPATPWWMAARPVSGELQQWGEEAAPVARFERSFAAAGERVELEVSALGSFEVWLNGRPLPAARGGQREVLRVDLSPHLSPGRNRLRVDVANRRGPALLSARLQGAAPEPGGDAGWRVEQDGERLPAIPADDTRINPTSLGTETPLEAIGRKRDTLLLLFLIGALGFALARPRLGPAARRALPWLGLGAASLAWLAWLGAVVARIPVSLGFDAKHHIVYVELLRSERALPLATDGWSTFHPPLFYLAAWASGPAAWKLLPWLAGLGVVWIAFGLARRLFPDDPRRQLLALAFAAVLPMNLYSSAYFSNESLHTLLASAALGSTAALLLAERPRPRAAALCGALYGLAALTKFTVLLLVPLAVAALVLRVAVGGAGARRALGLGAALAGAFLAVAGWYYLRNWILLGAPLVGNWELPGADRGWWQQPGFHTLAWYTGFGESLIHPYLSGYHSFADAVYSTLWGDGFVAGRVNATDRHGFWSYDFMSAGYWVALPAMGLLGVGALDALARALRPGQAGRRVAFGLLVAASWVVAVAFLYLTLRLPFYAQAKAAYALVLTGPLAVFFALGAARLDGWLAPWPPGRALFWGWLSLFAGTLFLGFGVL